MRSRILAVLLTLAAAPSLVAQTALRVTLQTSGSFSAVTDGSTVSVPSSGREANAVVSLNNTGTSPLTISQIALSGTDFALTFVPSTPLTLMAFGFASFSVRYTPTSGRAGAAVATIAYTEANVGRQFTFNLTGTAPDFVYTVTSSDGARSPVTSGARINFGVVRVGTPLTYVLSVQNRGTAAGVLNGVAVTGRDFTAAFVGPVSVAPGQEISIPIVFNPQTRGLSAGTLSIDGVVSTVGLLLEGTGAAPDYVFAYALRSDNNARALSNGSRMTFTETPAAGTALAEVIVGNQGNGNGQVRSIVLEGSAFQLNSLPLLPSTLQPGATFRFFVQFAPPRLGSFTGSLRIETDDRTLNVIVEGTTANPTLSLSYIDPQTRNFVPVASQSTAVFPATLVGSNVTYTMVLANTGVGTGFVNSVSVQGEGFTLTDLPSLPSTLPGARDFRFGVQFSPRLRQSYTGFLQIETTTETFSVRISGQGTGPSLAVEAADPDSAFQPVPGGTELSFTAAVGQSLLKNIRFTNVGDRQATVTAVSVAGNTAFQLTNLPFLPLSLAVGEAQTFSVAFIPTQSGVVRTRLRVDDQFVDLVGTGLAPRLDFSYTNDAGTTEVAAGGTVVLTPARVGESSRLQVTVANNGTSAAVISTVDVSPVNAPFVIESVMALPFQLEPGGVFHVGVRFQPDNIGTQTAVLRINNTGLNLSGNARQPVPLPGYRVEGPSGQQQPLQQPAVGLRLEAPYPLPLRGTLTLSFLSDVYAENPAVQFATGGRVSAFTIPAGSTAAVFENGATEIRLQTGTLAGTIQVRPSFATTSGLNLTPADVQELTMSVGRLSPRVLSAEIASRTRTGLSLVVTGYSTTRTLRQMTINLTPRAGQRLSTTQIVANLESISLVWFQSTASQGFGGLFSLEIPLSLQQDSSTDDLVSRIESLELTITNDVGVSNSVRVPL